MRFRNFFLPFQNKTRVDIKGNFRSCQLPFIMFSISVSTGGLNKPCIDTSVGASRSSPWTAATNHTMMLTPNRQLHNQPNIITTPSSLPHMQFPAWPVSGRMSLATSPAAMGYNPAVVTPTATQKLQRNHAPKANGNSKQVEKSKTERRVQNRTHRACGYCASKKLKCSGERPCQR